MTVFIGGAWPYANGSLHLGHLVALLPGDLLARYFRLKGEEVLYVSGSDCHGTPIVLRSKAEGVSPAVIADRYHQEIAACFEQLGFTYDLYSRTDRAFHRHAVQKLFIKLQERDKLKPRRVAQVYCNDCAQFLADRYVEGNCPYCGELARGDQCEHCSTLLDPLEIINKRCKVCGSNPVVKETEHLYFALAGLQSEIEKYFQQYSRHWRENAVKLTERYLKEGLQDRAVTRDLPWGITVPLAGFESKRIYVWVEAVLGYLTASMEWAQQRGQSWKRFWGDDVRSYFVHGKDNIPFHTIILPALLKVLGGFHLPDRILSSEYLNIEGKKISTSRNWAIWLPDMLADYPADSIRYFMIANSPEKRDCNFSWEEFINSHNGELLGAYGNFVHRTLVFVEKYYQGEIPGGVIPKQLAKKLGDLYKTTGEKIEKGEFKSALEGVFTLIRWANKFFDREQPWLTRLSKPGNCAQTIFVCTQIIANLAHLLEPFLPFSTEKIRLCLRMNDPSWDLTVIPAGIKIQAPEILFPRIDQKRIAEERERLNKKGNGGRC